jgi:glycosyltransferase 2 family protein
MGEESTGERLEAAARQATVATRSDDLSKRVQTGAAMAPSARKALRLLQVLVAAAMVAWVCTRISLSDRAERRGPDGRVVELRHGRAEGSVEGDVIRIRDPAGPIAELRKADGWQVRPGLLTLLRDLRPGLYAAAILLAVAAILLTAIRWRLLLQAVGIEANLSTSARLVWIGLFFNLVVPGLTGGDVVRAVLVARGNPRPEAAVVSVLVDRLVGLAALVGLAGVVVVAQWTRFPEIAPAVLAVVAGMGALSGILLSRSLRRALRIDRLLRILPFGAVLGRVDEAVLAYRGRPGALLRALGLSVGNHLLCLACVLLVGRALGDRTPVGTYLVLVPVVTLLTAVPLAPAGWGVGEALYGELFHRYGSAFETGVAVSLLWRLGSMAVSLPGAVLWLRQRPRDHGGRSTD